MTKSSCFESVNHVFEDGYTSLVPIYLEGGEVVPITVALFSIVNIVGPTLRRDGYKRSLVSLAASVEQISNNPEGSRGLVITDDPELRSVQIMPTETKIIDETPFDHSVRTALVQQLLSAWCVMANANYPSTPEAPYLL